MASVCWNSLLALARALRISLIAWAVSMMRLAKAAILASPEFAMSTIFFLTSSVVMPNAFKASSESPRNTCARLVPALARSASVTTGGSSLATTASLTLLMVLGLFAAFRALASAVTEVITFTPLASPRPVRTAPSDSAAMMPLASTCVLAGPGAAPRRPPVRTERAPLPIPAMPRKAPAIPPAMAFTMSTSGLSSAPSFEAQFEMSTKPMTASATPPAKFRIGVSSSFSATETIVTRSAMATHDHWKAVTTTVATLTKTLPIDEARRATDNSALRNGLMPS